MNGIMNPNIITTIAICRYLHCSEQVVNSTCGATTAGFTKKFLDRMSGEWWRQGWWWQCCTTRV